MVFTWAVSGSGVANYGTNGDRTPVFQKAWLARASSESTDGEIVLQNIPYEKYDVIVYVSGKSSVTTVRAVRVNGLPYRWSGSKNEMESSDSAWGAMQNTPEIGKNALRIPGVTTPDLHIRMASATSYGISAVQIVRDMTAGNENGYKKATGKVISVNLQSAKDNTGYTTGNVGLESVPYDAWTQDGLSLASNGANYDSDVSVDVKEWDAEKQAVRTLSGVTLHETVKNAYYFGSDYVPQPRILSGYADDSARPEITVTGVPYASYDVIVYCATDGENKYFGPVTVNGTPYRWSTSGGTTQEASGDTSTSGTIWGRSRCRVMVYGVNAIRVTGQTESTLTIKGGDNANSGRGCIAGFQIVDTTVYNNDEKTIEDGGTLEIAQAIGNDEAWTVVSAGSITVKGVDYMVTNADLSKIDFSGVEGSVTLGANTCYELGANRALPAGFVFGDGSAVAISESVEEYAKDEFSVSGLTGVAKVVLTHYDGTTETITVTGGEASSGVGRNARVTGVAALYDFTFTNTVHTAEGSRKSTSLEIDGGYSADWKTSDTDGTGINAWTGPWISLASTLPKWKEFSTVVVGQMPTEAKKMFVSFGSTASGGKMLYLATGSKENEVIVGYTGQSTPVATMTVPNASKTRHVYTFVVANERKELYIYLDGVFWKKGTSESGFSFGTSSHGGIQIGSGFGGNPSGYGRPAQDDTGVFYSLLIYDYILSEAQIEKLQKLYPYNSPHGSYERDVSGAETFSSADSWTKAGESDVKYEVPEDGASVSLKTLTDAEVEVNATLSLESLTLEGDGALTLKKGTGLLTSAGLTTIATDVTIEGGAADISGAPTVITEGSTLCFDYKEYDLFAYTGTSLVPLTGEVEEQEQGVVTCELPAGDFTREHTSEFLYTNGCYQLLVTSREGRDVYLPAGTTNFADDTLVKYFVEVPVDPEVQGDPEIVTNECCAIAADTVHFSDADIVTVARTCPVAGYDFGEYAGRLVFAPGQEELVLNTAITGAGKVEVSSGTVQSRGSIATDIDVASGAVLKLGSVGGFGATGGGTTPSGKAITVAGTVELNGVRDSCNAFTLNGGTLRNTGAEIPTGSRQTTALTLTANSTVHAGSDFGLVGSGYAATSLELGGYTLAKTGDAKFWLYNTRSTGAGTVDIQAGSVYAYSAVNMPNVGFNIAEGATLKVRTDDFDAGALSGSGAVDLYTYRPSQTLEFAAGSSLVVTITLASTTESLIEIPYTGTPNSVTVFGTDGTSADPAATVSYEDGKIVVRVDVANLSRTNPVTGESLTFTYAFFGTADADWKTLGNWKTAAGNRWADVTGTIPARPSSDKWNPVLLDGDLVAYTAGEDGYKSVSVSTLEGWELKVACLNGVKLTATTVNKHQNGCWYWIDETSKLVLGTKGSDNNSSNVDLYVAAKEGINFNSDFDFNDCTVKYNFKGDGSAVYSAGPNKGTHQIRRVILPKGNDQTRLKKLITRKLVSFPEGGASVTFGTDSMEVTSLDTTLTMTAYSGEGNLTTESDFGTYQLTQETDGVYITYVGYGKPFYLFLR